MDSSAVVWIVVAVVAVIVIAALVLAARNRRNQRRHVEAERIRDDLDTHVAKVDKREALADETAARARAAQAEAEAKAAEAARLNDRAESHRGVVSESREDIEKRREHADRLDPRTRVQTDGDQQDAVRRDDVGHDAAAAQRGEQDPTAQQAAGREPERR
jgi:type IV secretory pathway VirB10-like protein